MDDIAELDIKGLSVTIPHKEAVIEKLTRIDGAVRGIGAANTVVIQGDERVGYNTDYRAAMDSIEAAMEIGEKEESPLRNKLVMVLGAGGVGKAIAYGMLRRGTHVVIADGLDQKAADLSRSSSAATSRGPNGMRSWPTCWSTARPSACTPMWTRLLSRRSTCVRK